MNRVPSRGELLQQYQKEALDNKDRKFNQVNKKIKQYKKSEAKQNRRRKENKCSS